MRKKLLIAAIMIVMLMAASKAAPAYADGGCPGWTEFIRWAVDASLTQATFTSLSGKALSARAALADPEGVGQIAFEIQGADLGNLARTLKVIASPGQSPQDYLEELRAATSGLSSSQSGWKVTVSKSDFPCGGPPGAPAGEENPALEFLEMVISEHTDWLIVGVGATLLLLLGVKTLSRSAVF